MFWVRPWSTSPSAAPAAADQLARCPLPVFGWPMAPGGLPWSMPPELAQNYAKFASQNHIASRNRQSPAQADKCSDMSDGERDDAAVTKVAEEEEEEEQHCARSGGARTPTTSTDDKSPVPSASREGGSAWKAEDLSQENPESQRDDWSMPSRLRASTSPVGYERERSSHYDASGRRRRNSLDVDTAAYEPSDLRLTSSRARDGSGSEGRREESPIAQKSSSIRCSSREGNSNSPLPHHYHHHHQQQQMKMQQTSPLAATTGPILRHRSIDDEELDGEEDMHDDDNDGGSLPSPTGRSVHSSPPSHQLEIKTQRPLGLLAQHGLVAKASSSSSSSTSFLHLPDASKLQQQQSQLAPSTFIDYAAQYQSLLNARNNAAGPATSLPPPPRSASPQSSMHHWTFEEQFKQLYELSPDLKRREFLDELFSFMQKRGTPVNRIPIMAKRVLDLYELYRLVVSKGGLVEVINKKLWREITKELNLPSSITSAAFTLRTQYMKYIYPYECEKLKLSTPAELQMAIDGNRREGRRPSYGGYDYPPPASGDGFLPSPGLSALANGRQTGSPSPSSRSRDGDDDSPPPSLSYIQMGGGGGAAGSDPARSRVRLASPLDHRTSAPPPLRLTSVGSDHHLGHLANPYLTPGGAGAGHSPLGRPNRPSPADSRLFFGALQDRLPSPPPSRSFFPGVQPLMSASNGARAASDMRVPRASPLSLSPKNMPLAGSTATRDRDDPSSEAPAAKRLAMDETNRLFYPFSLPTAHFKITSRNDGRSEFDNSVVVSMEINGIMYQGVLFSQQVRRR